MNKIFSSIIFHKKIISCNKFKNFAAIFLCIYTNNKIKEYIMTDKNSKDSKNC